MAQHGCTVAHCPSSNLKLASGFAPVATCWAQGLTWAWERMGPRATTASNVRGNAPCRTAGEGAERQGGCAARVAGIANGNTQRRQGAGAGVALIGSLLPGKAADITAVDFSSLELAPCYDPVSHLVYAAGREHVSHVWVNGKMLLNDGELTTLDEQELLRQGGILAGTDGNNSTGPMSRRINEQTNGKR